MFCLRSSYKFSLDLYLKIYTINSVKNIVCAAMKMDDRMIILGIRHYSPDMRAVLLRLYGTGYHHRVKEQGFVDQYGKFHTREEAWIVAAFAGQIKKVVSTPGTLYSENLY